MQDWLRIWEQEGFATVRKTWLAAAAGIGDPISAATPRDRLQGVFETLDPDGALLLRDAAGAAHRITAADVFFG